MTLTLEDLPVADTMPVGRAGEADPAYPLQFERRGFLAASMKLLLFIGLFSLGLASRARRAFAEFPNYNEWKNASQPNRLSACGIYDPDTWYGNDGNQNGWTDPGTCTDDVCVGSSDDLMGPGYCVKCNEQSSSNPIGWHFTGMRGNSTYGDIPSICNPTGAGSRDAWRWAVSSCAGCAPAVFRCHDGFKRYPNGDSDLTICQALVACNGAVVNPC